ncbi:MAG TPA: universal stress protein [Bacteroidia bacterium]|nr:universal stress protein [Bacteroidia bacterium]
MKILVPIDFTPVTENALKYSIGLTDVLSVSHVILFHVVASDKDADAASEKLTALIQNYKDQTRASLESNIKPGNIFDQIGKTAAELEASLIVMGTHGIKGMQKILGSRAMRVITNSETPYIVVQKKPYSQIKKILIPVDYTHEVKQILPLLQSLNDKFKAVFHLIKEEAKDDFISNKIRNNLVYFKSFLNDNNISFAEAGTYVASAKYKDVLKQADSTGADLIVTTIDPETNITDYIMGVEEQKLVANESQIPVLCVNIKQIMNRKGNFFESI